MLRRSLKTVATRSRPHEEPDSSIALAIEAMAHLGLYYAEKIRAADTKQKQPQQAVEHLKKAVAHWKDYATIGQRQYKPQLLSKGGLADWQRGYENVLQDIVLLGGDPNQ